jgi:hypothetical protein
VEVELRPFNDRQLNRDLETVYAQVNAEEPRLPDGQLLQFQVRAHAFTTFSNTDIAPVNS